MTDTWIDVFLTKADTDTKEAAYTYNDHFVAAYHSVRILPKQGRAYALGTSSACVVDEHSDWVMPAYALNYDAITPCGSDGLIAEGIHPEVGDVVRIGNSNTGHTSDYCTVLETKEINIVYDMVNLKR